MPDTNEILEKFGRQHVDTLTDVGKRHRLLGRIAEASGGTISVLQSAFDLAIRRGDAAMIRDIVAFAAKNVATLDSFHADFRSVIDSEIKARQEARVRAQARSRVKAGAAHQAHPSEASALPPTSRPALTRPDSENL